MDAGAGGRITFYLGTHEPSWLARSRVPLFLSRRRLARQKTAPVARCRWALDSGGYSELALHGRWKTPAKRYAEEAQTYRRDVQRLDWAAIQDWMVDDATLKRTRKSVREHQRRTLESFLELRALAREVPWIPILQGRDLREVFSHLDLYLDAGVEAAAAPVVGLGSVCRRQADREVHEIIARLTGMGLRVHAFGLKTTGLRHVGHLLASADSMAWSYRARRWPAMPGCTHVRCSNCFDYAMQWRRGLMRSMRAA